MRRSRLLLLLLAGGLAAPGPAWPAEDGLTAVYAFSWAGLEVGRFELELAAAADGYRASWEAGTAGLVGTLFPFVSEGAAEGRRDGDRFLPSVFGGRSEWRDGGSAWRVTFAADGRVRDLEVPAEDLADRDPVPAELQVGPDPASLALTAIERAAPGLRMDGRSFDGRRAVELQLACGERDAAAELPCTISSRLLAGGSREWQARRAAEPQREPVKVWLREGIRGPGFWPVRIEAPSRFGTVEARLVSVDGVPPA